MKSFPKHEVASMLLGRATRRVAAKLTGDKKFRFKALTGLWTDTEELEAWIDISRAYSGTLNIPHQEYELAAAQATKDRARATKALKVLGKIWRRHIVISSERDHHWLAPAVAKHLLLFRELRPEMLANELRLFRNTCRKQQIEFEKIWPKRGISRRVEDRKLRDQ